MKLSEPKSTENFECNIYSRCKTVTRDNDIDESTGNCGRHLYTSEKAFDSSF